MDASEWNKLSDFEINTLVAKSLCYLVSDETQDNDESVYCGHDGYAWSLRDFCNDPSESWQIISKFRISIVFDASEDWASVWCNASTIDGYFGIDFQSNPLRAGMIVFLMMHEDK